MLIYFIYTPFLSVHRVSPWFWTTLSVITLGRSSNGHAVSRASRGGHSVHGQLDQFRIIHLPTERGGRAPSFVYSLTSPFWLFVLVSLPNLGSFFLSLTLPRAYLLPFVFVHLFTTFILHSQRSSSFSLVLLILAHLFSFYSFSRLFTLLSIVFYFV